MFGYREGLGAAKAYVVKNFVHDLTIGGHFWENFVFGMQPDPVCDAQCTGGGVKGTTPNNF